MVSKKIEFEYDKKVPFDKRKIEADTVMSKHPGKVPIIVQARDGSKLTITKNKFLVPREETVRSFMKQLRSRITLEAGEALFLLVCNKSCPPGDSMIGEIYDKHKDLDGFLRIVFSEENTFG